jgi:NodT family efflux transporter outer membrane factor (OMF) lipoprotein
MTDRLRQGNCKGRNPWMLGGLSMLVLSGCTVGPDFVRPKAPVADHYNQRQDPAETVAVEGHSQRFEQGVGPVANWWGLFGSKQLDAVVAEGFANNPSIEAAQASLRQSNDNLQAGYGIFYPQINAGLGASRQKSSPASIGSPLPGSVFNLVTLSASVSYPLDIFGGERRAIENLQSQVDLQRYYVLGTYLALSGNIVNTAIAMAAYQEEVKYTEQLIALQKEQIAITEKQAEAGIVPFASVLGLRNQLASLEAALPPLRQRLSQSEHLLATLAGRAPSEWTPAQIALAELSLPGTLPLSLPSELVRQRPDILMAEEQLHGASASIGVATAAQFPSFTLNGTYGQSRSSMSGLFGSNANFWSLGADIAAPLFNGGTLSARKQAAIDAYQQSLALYRQTVLDSFAQVADTVRALEHDAETMQAEAQSVSTSEQSLHLTEVNYQAGLVNYLQVLAADILYHQAQLGYLQARAQRLQDTTALYVALGGGWWNASDTRKQAEKAPQTP